MEKETQAWVAEFQLNLQQLEQQTRQAWEAAREDARKAAEQARQQAEARAKLVQAAREEMRPGAVELTVHSSVALAEGYSVELDGRTQRQQLTGPTCGLVDLRPGLHELAAVAQAGGRRLQASRVVQVAPNEVVAVELTLS